VAPKLSHQSTAGGGCFMPNSFNADGIQMTSTMAFAFNSASVLDHDIVGCFLELQDTRFVPR
jgi:hypothetical protein